MDVIKEVSSMGYTQKMMNISVETSWPSVWNEFLLKVWKVWSLKILSGPVWTCPRVVYVVCLKWGNEV